MKKINKDCVKRYVNKQLISAAKVISILRENSKKFLAN